MPSPKPLTVVELAYRYLARDWGLIDDTLTSKKCDILRRTIPKLRRSYREERRIRYDQVSVRRAYVASYAPRYARLLSAALRKIKKGALPVARRWHRKELVVAMFGGGPAFELYGLIYWLYEVRTFRINSDCCQPKEWLVLDLNPPRDDKLPCGQLLDSCRGSY